MTGRLAPERLSYFSASMFNQSTVSALRSGLSELLGPGMATALQSAPEAIRFAYPAEADSMAHAAENRQREFIGGRACVREAAVKLDLEPFALLNDSEGAPLWPESVRGSISHTRGLCAAVLARTADYSCIGLDIERIDRLTAGAQRRVMHSEELALWGDSQRIGSLLFSAKEAFYKSQYAEYGAKPSFHDLRLSIDARNGVFEVMGTHGLPEPLKQVAHRMQFGFVEIERYVITLCFLRSHPEHV